MPVTTPWQDVMHWSGVKTVKNTFSNEIILQCCSLFFIYSENAIQLIKTDKSSATTESIIYEELLRSLLLWFLNTAWSTSLDADWLVNAKSNWNSDSDLSFSRWMMELCIGMHSRVTLETSFGNVHRTQTKLSRITLTAQPVVRNVSYLPPLCGI